MMETNIGPHASGIVLGFAEEIMRRPPDQVISRGGLGYMERWFLARKSMIPALGSANITSDTARSSLNWVASEIENIFIHRYKRPDMDEMLHDHPWDNVSLVLRGSVTELLDGGVQRHLVAGSVVGRRATEKHMIADIETDTVTLFGTGKKCRDWGFYDDDGKFIPWQELPGAE